MVTSKASEALRLFVIGGHGKVAQHFTRHAVARGHTVYSQLRQPEHANDVPGHDTDNVRPVVVSLEDASVDSLSDLFKKHNPQVILFIAGAGGKGGPERTFAVDRDGAIKVFDAIERSQLSDLRRFLLCSAVDSRDIGKTKPDWYSDEDFQTSKRMRETLGTYMEAKHAADVDLSRRKSFPWFVLRPSRLLDDAGTGKVSLGERKTISQPVPREDVARVFLELAELPKGQGDGLMLDLTQGSADVAQAVKDATHRGRTDWLG
ncbi:unnamed protein product [Parajaminaea phylloscopi]